MGDHCCSDIGGFFAGSYLGKHRLVPAISPHKTWEGLAGSALACLIAGGVLLPVLLPGHAWQGLLLGAAVVVVATLGDLVESMIKRDLGIKDMGTLLPGHGGILDRIDALLLSAPVAWLLLLSGVRHPIAHGIHSAEADALRSRTFLPAHLWTLLWLAGAVAALLVGGKFLVLG